MCDVEKHCLERKLTKLIFRTVLTELLLKQQLTGVVIMITIIMVDSLSRVKRPTKHIIGHIGDGFLWVK